MLAEVVEPISTICADEAIKKYRDKPIATIVSYMIKNHKKEAMTYYMMTGVVLFLIVMIKILGVSAKTLYSGMLQYMTSSISRVESQDFFYAWIMALLIFAALYAVIFLLLHYKIWNLLLTVLLTVLLLLLFFWKM